MRSEVEVAEILVELEGRFSSGPPKTAAGRRRVPLPRPVMDELVPLLAGKNADDYVFQSPGGGPLRKSWVGRFFRPAVLLAGLEPLRVHDLRHTAVAMWIAAGAHVREIQTWAGHASAVTILNVYGHVLPTAEDKVRTALESLMAAVPKAREAKVLPISAPD